MCVADGEPWPPDSKTPALSLAPASPACLHSLSVYSLTHKLGWDPFSPQLFVWKIPQILSKWPASPSCLSGCVSVERISLETAPSQLQGSFSPLFPRKLLCRLCSVEGCLITPKLLARRAGNVCKLGRQTVLGLPSLVDEEEEFPILWHLLGTRHCFWLFIVLFQPHNHPAE